jgi:glucokinase
MSARGGLDLGGTKIQAAVVDEDGKVLGEDRRPTPTEGGPQDVVDAMADALRAAAQRAGVAPGELQGVGVGSPGEVDERRGTVTSARNLPGWEGEFPVADALSAEIGVPVAVGNDVQVATEAEFHLGAASAFPSLLGVFWGTGVGSGIILDGEPWLGRGAAGEFGHMVVKLDGARCTCGRRGCVEAYAGRGAMELRARRRQAKGEKTDLFAIMEKRGRTRLTSAVWAKALEKGDKMAVELIDEAVAALAAGIASAINLIDVEAVIIGGGLGLKLGEPYVERLREAMLPHLFVDQHPPTVALAELGDLGGAVGAALLVSRSLQPAGG